MRTLTSALSVLASLFLAGVPDSSLAAQTSPPLPQRFRIDASHSNIGFSVRFMGLSTVRGAFSRFAGTLMYVEARPEQSSVSVVIDAKSINSNSEGRDRHLRTADFLDVETYPHITFFSTRIARTDSGFVAEGPLTIRGTTRDVAIPFVIVNQPTSDAWGNRRATFAGALRINRQDYGVKGTAFWNSEFDPGRMAVSDNLDIELLVSATIANPGRWTHRVGDSLLAGIEARGVAPVVRELEAAKAGRPAAVDSIPPFAFADAGEKLIMKSRLADAIALYEGAVRVRPAEPAFRVLLGEAYVKSGRRADALREFQTVLRSDSLDTDAIEWKRVLERAGVRGSAASAR